MRILVIEDEDTKFEKFLKAFQNNSIRPESIVRLDNLVDLLRHSDKLGAYDLCLIDFFLPLRSGDQEVENCTKDILKSLDHSSLNSIPVLAITSYLNDPNFDLNSIKSRGILAYDFMDEAVWTIAIQSFIARAQGRHKYDFVGILALEEERQGYLRHPEIKVERKKVIGLDAWEVEFKGKLGCLFCLPKMGLVDASIATTKVLENFSPRVAFMSGICGGSDDTSMGQLLVTNFCWEYQSGKWYDDGFQSDPYQEGISENLKAELNIYLKSNANIIQKLEVGLIDLERPTKLTDPILAIFASGSAVIASKEQMKKIKGQHRKVKGVDMEIFGFHRSLNLQQEPIVHFSCKAVVDKADVNKSDEIHEYGSAISALFCLDVLETIFFPDWDKA